MNHEKVRRLNKYSYSLQETRRIQDEYKKLRGQAAKRRDKSISDKLHEVHQPWHQRPAEDTIHNDGTILFDLT